MGIAPAAAAIVATSLFTGGRQAQRKVRRSEVKKGRTAAAEEGVAIESANKAAREKAITNESVKAQKDKARKRTIFAGSGTNNIFAPTLGGASGNKTLG